VTAIVYYQLGLFIAESENILPVFIPSVVIGIPLGAYVIRRLDAETFRRICMSFDAWVVGFGLSRVLIELNLMESPWAYSVMAVTILIDLYLLYIFFTKRSQKLWAPMTPGDRSRPPSRFPSDMTDDPFAVAAGIWLARASRDRRGDCYICAGPTPAYRAVRIEPAVPVIGTRGKRAVAIGFLHSCRAWHRR